MGKNLIIKGADFSANGFLYHEVVTDASTLYMAGDIVVTAGNFADTATATNSMLVGELTDGTLSIGGGSKYGVSAKADCSGYEKVSVKTIPNFTPQASYYGFAVLLFTDESGNIVGGLTNAAAGSTSPSGKTEGVGQSGTLTSFECAVPSGAKYVYSTFRGGATVSPFDAGSTFEMKLYKTGVVDPE